MATQVATKYIYKFGLFYTYGRLKLHAYTNNLCVYGCRMVGS